MIKNIIIAICFINALFTTGCSNENRGEVSSRKSSESSSKRYHKKKHSGKSRSHHPRSGIQSAPRSSYRQRQRSKEYIPYQKPSLTFSSEHLRFGAPGYNPKDKRYELLIRDGFAILYDNVRKGPSWVSYRLTRDYTRRRVSRAGNEAFRPDPNLLPRNRSELIDYRGSGWDRGHMVPAADMRKNEKVQLETFYLSNIIPQERSNNAGLWAELEALGRGYAKQYGDIQVISGTIYGIPTPTGRLYGTIGPDRVSIPTWLYKIFIRKTNEGYRVLAFKVPNMRIPVGKRAEDYLAPLQSIEKDTHYNFLTKLPKGEQEKLTREIPRHLWYLDHTNGSEYFHMKNRQVHYRGQRSNQGEQTYRLTPQHSSL